MIKTPTEFTRKDKKKVIYVVANFVFLQPIQRRANSLISGLCRDAEHTGTLDISYMLCNEMSNFTSKNWLSAQSALQESHVLPGLQCIKIWNILFKHILCVEAFRMEIEYDSITINVLSVHYGSSLGHQDTARTLTNKNDLYEILSWNFPLCLMLLYISHNAIRVPADHGGVRISTHFISI